MCIVCQRRCSTPLCWTSRRWLVGEILLDPEKVPCFSAETQWSPCLAGLRALEMGLVAVTCLVALYLRRGFYKCPGVDWLGYIAFCLCRVCVSVQVASACHDVISSSGFWSLSKLRLHDALPSTSRMWEGETYNLVFVLKLSSTLLNWGVCKAKGKPHVLPDGNHWSGWFMSLWEMNKQKGKCYEESKKKDHRNKNNEKKSMLRWMQIAKKMTKI